MVRPFAGRWVSEIGVEERIPIRNDERPAGGRRGLPGDLAVGIAIDDQHALDLERPLPAGDIELACVEGAIAPATDDDDVAGGDGARDRRW
jgi:hypothetical protein